MGDEIATHSNPFRWRLSGSIAAAHVRSAHGDAAVRTVHLGVALVFVVVVSQELAFRIGYCAGTKDILKSIYFLLARKNFDKTFDSFGSLHVAWT